MNSDEVWACRAAVVQLCKSGRSAKQILKALRSEGYSTRVINKALDQI